MRILFSLVIVLLVVQPALAAWDYSKQSIDVEQIISGGPPKDAIPALLSPKFMAGQKATFMRADEQVLGVEINGITRAYPIRILSWHELVNDKFGDTAVLVSW
jgi:hypothetical protein